MSAAPFEEAALSPAFEGTLGVLTGSMGLLVRERPPKKRMGLSGLAALVATAADGAAAEAPAALLSVAVGEETVDEVEVGPLGAVCASNLARPFATAPEGWR